MMNLNKELFAQLIRELYEIADEGDFSKIPSVGSSLEQQIRAHYTRADGSLDHDGYFSALMDYPLNPSSDDSDSDSSSGASSDCVIISPSSFTGKRKDTTLTIVAAN
jgi:hypothetical protein